jgi:hypothetical protein
MLDFFMQRSKYNLQGVEVGVVTTEPTAEVVEEVAHMHAKLYLLPR